MDRRSGWCAGLLLLGVSGACEPAPAPTGPASGFVHFRQHAGAWGPGYTQRDLTIRTDGRVVYSVGDGRHLDMAGNMAPTTRDTVVPDTVAQRLMDLLVSAGIGDLDDLPAPAGDPGIFVEGSIDGGHFQASMPRGLGARVEQAVDEIIRELFRQQ